MKYARLIFALVLGLYFLWVAYDPSQGSVLDLINLPIHEAGHLIFSPLGEFMMVVGGSLFQVIMPFLFVLYFWRREDYYSASIVLFWVGQSVLNVYVYANDAVVMQLVLITGFTGSEGSFHDWNYLLTRTGLIDSTKTIANLIRLFGTLIILLALVSSLFYAYHQTEK